MNYDFDTVTDRKNTNAIKYDLAKKRGKPEDAVSLWVADMDFPTQLLVFRKRWQKKQLTESGAIVVRITDIMML